MPPRKASPAEPAGTPDDARTTAAGAAPGAGEQQAETGFLADCEAVVERLKGLLPVKPGEDDTAQARLLFQPWRDYAARYRVLRSCLPQDSMADDSGWRQTDRQVSLVTSLLTPPMPADAEIGKTQLLLAGQLIGRIIEREGAAETSLVAKARSAGLDSDDLERWLAAFAEDRDPPPWSPAQKRRSTSTEEAMMPRNTNMPDRDDRGRFVGDDDRGYSSRGSGRDRDEQGRFTSDDDRGYRSRSAGRERDDQGRFTSDDDRRYSRGRYDDDDRGRGQQGQGWYGDREGHAEAARLGWEHRRGDADYGRGGGYRSGGRERDEQGRFTSDDDRRYSRSRYDDDDRGRGQQGQGWYGDPEGHSEASRLGWERRRDDDDDRGRSSRYRR